MCGHTNPPRLMFSMGRSHPRAGNTLQLGKTTGNSSTIQDWEPWFSKATRDLVSILTTFQESWWQDDKDSAFPEILEAFHTKNWKWRQTKSVMLSCGQNVHRCTSHGFLLGWILPNFFHKLSLFSAQFTWGACTLSHGWTQKFLWMYTLALISICSLHQNDQLKMLWKSIF